jgi:hypothetical protein
MYSMWNAPSDRDYYESLGDPRDDYEYERENTMENETKDFLDVCVGVYRAMDELDQVASTDPAKAAGIAYGALRFYRHLEKWLADEVASWNGNLEPGDRAVRECATPNAARTNCDGYYIAGTGADMCASCRFKARFDAQRRAEREPGAREHDACPF